MDYVIISYFIYLYFLSLIKKINTTFKYTESLSNALFHQVNSILINLINYLLINELLLLKNPKTILNLNFLILKLIII